MSGIESLSILRFSPAYFNDVTQILLNAGGSQRYIDGQLRLIADFMNDKQNSLTLVACYNDNAVGYVAARFYQWNRITKIHALAVDTSVNMQDNASALMNEIEDFAMSRQGRGIYAETSVTNIRARAFYKRRRYQEDHIMSAYYDDDLDGITYLKLFGTSDF